MHADRQVASFPSVPSTRAYVQATVGANRVACAEVLIYGRALKHEVPSLVSLFCAWCNLFVSGHCWLMLFLHNINLLFRQMAPVVCFQAGRATILCNRLFSPAVILWTSSLTSICFLLWCNRLFSTSGPGPAAKHVLVCKNHIEENT